MGDVNRATSGESAKRPFGTVEALASGHWRARFYWPKTGPDRQRYTAPTTFGSADEARVWLRNQKAAIELSAVTGKPWESPAEAATKARAEASAAAVKAAVPTVGEYVLNKINGRAKRAKKPITPTTRDNYLKCYRLAIAPTLAEVPLDQLTRDVVEYWWAGLPKGTPTQNGNAYDLLRSIMAEAVEDDLVGRNPVRVRGAGKPAPQHQAVTLTPAEVAAYLDAAPEERRVALAVGLGAGLRSGEIRGLRRRDIDLAKRQLNVAQAVSRTYVSDHERAWRIAAPKTEAGSRSVPLPDWLVGDLRVWLAALPAKDGEALVFPAGDGKSPLSEVTLHEAHKKAAAAIGHPDMTVHDLRKTYLTLLEGAGAGLGVLKAIGGHTTVEMVLKYQAPGSDLLHAPADTLGNSVAAEIARLRESD